MHTAQERVFTYHERTKHYPNRYARSAGRMDWENEPIPFRTYEGAEQIPLPLLAADLQADFTGIYTSAAARKPFTFENISSFLELSLGLSAWKSAQGSTWALRINPSSGNLHPTEAYLVLPPMACLDEGGVFHYQPYLHALERRSAFGKSLWTEVEKGLAPDGFLIALTSIPWREAWKYGERAFRYCNHDVGHAIACLSFSARLHGWQARWMDWIGEADIAATLGVQKTRFHELELEYPELVLSIHGREAQPADHVLGGEALRALSRLDHIGMPNLLSRSHVDWDAITDVAAATEKPRIPEPQAEGSLPCSVDTAGRGISAAAVIRKRRSAQVYDGRTSMTKETFFALLGRTMPCAGTAPFDAGLGEAAIHLAIFAHRVEGLPQGLYMLLRKAVSLEPLKAVCDDSFLWQRVDNAPQSLPLYLLKQGDLREEAAFICCNQEIAADGCFSLGMIAEYRKTILRHPWLYRKLFWETGMIGQVLYLEAEASGLRGTGIGCFFDDLMHRLLGLKDDRYQSLYHFTVGAPVEDRRLTTLPPYHHRR